ncbi:MAG: hypothetical protein HYX48_05970 [Chlamydiales bacterium]|nr:hypothetical protein [Chlamydiales bacterium]
MAQPQPSPMQPKRKETPLNKGLQQIKGEIDKMLIKMQKDEKYTPNRTELDAYSARAFELIQKYHPKIASNQKNLISAVIDLTEVPIMHPKMQRVAYQVALKEASKNLEDYLASN